jgi:outer membrane protein assembly factor BamB
LLHEWTPKDPTYSQDASRSPEPSSELGRLNGVPVVFCRAGAKVVALEVASGKQVWQTQSLGACLARPPQVVDLDGDGQDDVLAVAEQSDNTLKLQALSGKTCQPLWTKTLAEDWTEGKRLLVRDREGWRDGPLRWPVLADLAGDGKYEVIVGVIPPSGRRTPGGGRVYTPWYRRRSGVEVLDGPTGRTRWRHSLGVGPTDDLGIQHFLVGPDLNGDGHKEVFVASAPRNPGTGSGNARAWAFVDALSGKDGRTLWCQPVSYSGYDRVGPLQWHQAGTDGWPRLLVRSEEGAYLLSAGTGRVCGELTGRRDYNQSMERCVQTGDLDGDGLTDLCACFPELRENPQVSSDEYRVHAIRGQAPEAWRRLGGWSTVQDLDGDGISDLIRPENTDSPDDRQDNPERVTAVSGRDGRILWQADTGRGRDSQSGGGGGGGGSDIGANPLDQGLGDLLAGTAHVKSFPLPHGDLDGDGTADLLVFAGQFGWATVDTVGDRRIDASYTYGSTPKGPLVALSGKTGRRLWTSDAEQLLPAGEQSANTSTNRLAVWPQLLACRDLNGDGRAEIILPYLAWTNGLGKQPNPQLRASPPGEFRLAVLAGGTGKVIWRATVGEVTRPSVGSALETLGDLRISAGSGDLDGDGALDIVVAVRGAGEEASATWDVRALSGRDGKVLWQRSVSGQPVQTPAVGDLDGDGKPDIVLNRYMGIDRQNHRHLGEVLALDGRTGQPKWTWPWPNDCCHHASVPVVADLEGHGRPGVLISLTKGACYDNNRKGEIVLLDAAGQVRQRVEVEQAWHGAPCFRACDVDGDGKSELLFFAAGKLRVTRGGVEQVLWERPCQAEFDRRLEVLPAAAGRPVTVLSWSWAKGDLFALDGPTGRPLWRAATGDLKAVIPSSDPKELPRLLYRPQHQDATLCRLALPTDATGRYAPPTPAPIAYAPPPDPRLAYGLPWAPAHEAYCFDPEAYGFFAGSIPAFLLGVVVPWVLVRSAVRQRSRPRGVAAGIYIVAVIACIGVFAYLRMPRMGPDASTLELLAFTLWPLVGMLAAGGPCVALLGSFLRGLANRRWRWAGLLLAGASLVLAVVIAAALLFFDPRMTGQGEYYRYDGWYLAWGVGAYGTGCLLVLVYLVRAAARGVRRLVRRRAATATATLL